jgi:uncharacterized protein YaiE (UPF0345 family)
MSSEIFEQVTCIKKANVYFDGKCVSHTLILNDGTRKTLGVIFATEEPLVFATQSAERMEIIDGSCRVRLHGESSFEVFNEGQSFFAPGDASFEIQAIGLLNYVCHFEG